MGKLRVLFFLLLISFGVSAQKIQKVNTYGYEYNRFIVDTLFALPGDTFTVPAALQSYPFLAKKGTTLYLWNTSTLVWASVSGGGGGTTYTFPYSVTAPGNAVQLENDTTASPANYFYGRNSVGRRGWYSSNGFAWGLKGDSGTTVGTNFIGTTDSVSFIIKVNNILAGQIDINQKNTSWGQEALLNRTTEGLSNVAIGYRAARNNTTADNNVAIGSQALELITTGGQNTAIGKSSLSSATVATTNTAIGYESQLNSTASGNTAVGHSSLRNNSTGATNVAIGNSSMTQNLTGGGNTAVGSQSLFGGTAGNNNTAIGYQSHYTAGTRDYNTAIGSVAMYYTTTGSLNTAVGYQSLNRNTIGEQNAALGVNSLLLNTTGIKNVAVGAGALENNTTGSFNTGVGQDALLNNISGFRNIGIGWNAKFGDSSYHNIGLGYGVGSSLTGGGNHDNTFIGGYQTAWNANQKVQPVHQIVIGSLAYGIRDSSVVLGDSAAIKETYLAGKVTIGNRTLFPDSAFNLYGGLKIVNGSQGAGKVLTSDANGNASWQTASVPATAISSLTAATGTNTIDNGGFMQRWDWNSLAEDIGLFLRSTATNGISPTLFSSTMSGVHSNPNITSISGNFTNQHTGTSSTNIAGQFIASGGTNNYAIIVPASEGSVGIGTSTPAKIFHTVGTVRHETLGTASGDTTANKPVGINSSGDIIPMTYWPGGGGSGGATVGTYSTRIGLSPSNGDEFFQTDIGRDAPDGKYYYLNSKWHYQPIRPETLTTFWNEFQSITTNQGYLDNGLIGWAGNSGSISFPSAPTLPGVAIFNTSTTTNGYAGFYGGAINNSGAWVMFDKGNCYFKAYINIPTLSDGTDTYSFRIGLGNGLLGDFSNGVYFEYSSATSANWLIKTANYTTRTSTTSGTAVATGWHTLEILTNSNGTSVEYWVDGTSLGTITTNIPGSGNAQNPTMIMQKSAGTNSRSIQVDYVKAWQRLTTQRN